MITTVTTTTTTTVTTITSASLGIVAICTVLLLLLNKELLLASDRPWATQLGRTLNVAIVPLIIVFATTAVAKIAHVLG